MLENIPKIQAERIYKQEEISRHIPDINLWMNERLDYLSKNNPMLYRYVIGRSQLFATASTSVNGLQELAMAYALDQLMFLELLNASIEDSANIEDFGSLMKRFFNGETPKGLDELGKNNGNGGKKKDKDNGD